MYFYFYYAVTIVSFWIESYFNCVVFIQDLQDIICPEAKHMM